MRNRVAAISLVTVLPIAGLPWLCELTGVWRAHDLARLLALAVAFVSTVALIYAARRQQTFASCRQALAWLGVGAVLLSVCLMAPAPNQAGREVVHLASLAAAAGCVAMVPLRASSWAWTGATAAYGATLLAIMSAAGLAGAAVPAGDALFFGYSNRRFFNHVQTVALPLCLGIAALAPQRWLRRTARVALAAGLALLLHSAGRATTLALVVGAIALAILTWGMGDLGRSIARRSGREAIKGVALAALLYVGVFIVAQGGSQLEAANPNLAVARLTDDQSRGALMRFAAEQALASPWFGIGPGHLAGLPGQRAAHPHNLPLQAAAEWGIPAALAMLAAAGWALVRLAQRVRRSGPGHASWGAVLWATWIAVAVDAQFSGNLVMPASQLWIAMLLGATLAWWRATATALEPTRRPWPRTALVLLLASQVWLAFDIWPEVRRLPEHLEEVWQRHPNDRLNPRFWSHGWFDLPASAPETTP